MPTDQTILFHSIVFGPVHSRRLGTSLGVNLSPSDGKVCSFDCIYCEAGYNRQGTGSTGLPHRAQVAAALRDALERMRDGGQKLDVITFSGNGEPTLNPDFADVVDDTLALRDEFFPEAKVSVLSNSTRIGDPKVFDALCKVDNNILKLDSAIDATMHLIDAPVQKSFCCADVISLLARFGRRCIVQTMLLRGSHDGRTVDNTTDSEIAALIKAYRTVKPASVMLYSLDRSTPEEHLVKVERDELERIAARVREATGLTVTVS